VNKLLGVFITIFGMIGFIALYVISMIIWIKIADKLKASKKEKKLKKLLSARSLESILAEAPYAYEHFQGEDGVRIWDKRIKDFVDYAETPFDAELWIVEHYLTDKKNDSK